LPSSFRWPKLVVTATNDCVVRCVHIQGIINRVPDLLSRWEGTTTQQKAFEELLKGKTVREVKVTNEMFEFEGNW
jgi:hypothetical protein